MDLPGKALPVPKIRRLVILGLLATAAALFAIVVIVERGKPENNGLPIAIQSVSPAQGDEVLSQVDIVVDLATGYTGELELNGMAIPEAELQRVDGLNLFSYRPGPGKQVETLLPDQNCARVTAWQISSGPEQTQIYTWCFNTA